ncbi:MAG: dynamin family protein [Ruminiclostridium sp.]|nr:dynamin family protein [Ruminiclostridium sp.]
MNIELLQLRQYLEIHPVAKREIKYRIGYLSMIKVLCDLHTKRDKWCNAMFSLMKKSLIGEAEVTPLEITDSGIIFKKKDNSRFAYIFHKYRYNILIDCLFLLAFDNKKRGKKLLNDVCRIFPRNKKKLMLLSEYFYKTDIEFVRKEFPSVYNICSVIAENRKFISLPRKNVIITANMSAGKSTLINALAGKKVNMTKNDTCTAKIHYLLNKSGEDGLSYEFDHELELNATKEILMNDNESNSTSEIIVGTRFRSLDEIPENVCFIDTPGVNSSQNKEHRQMTNNYISDKNCDLLIFLLNGENIGTDDDIKHIRYVSENYKGKIIFLVNKLDKYKKSVDSVRVTLEKVKEDLKGAGYKNPGVYPISAYAAYLAKMSLYGEKLSEDELDDLEFRIRKLNKEEFMYHTYYDTESPEIDENNEMEILLRNSGILSLEKIIYSEER